MVTVQLTTPFLWDFEPCIARRCIVIVGADPRYPAYWAQGLVGRKRQVVEVLRPNGELLYVDNEDGSGWLKVTEAPTGGYRELKARQLITYLD
jgi:hypothetical protein